MPNNNNNISTVQTHLQPANIPIVLRGISIALSAFKIFGHYSSEEERIRKIERELPRLRALLGKLDLEDEISAVEQQGDKARERLNEVNKKVVIAQSGVAAAENLNSAASVVRLFLPNIDDLNAAEAEFLEYLVRSREVYDKILHAAEIEFKEGRAKFQELEAIYQSEITAEQNVFRQDRLKERLDFLRQRHAPDQPHNVEMGQVKGVSSESSTPGKLPTTTPQSLFGNVELGKPKFSKVPTAPPEQTKKQVEETFTELTALSESFQNSFNAGMNAVGQSINQTLGGAFKGVFGEANSLLEIFIANFVNSMASNVISALTGGASGGILSILGFGQGGIINEPIFGIGKSGQRYLFGEAGREAVIPFSEMAAAAQTTRMVGAEGDLANEIRSMRRTIESGAWRLKGRDLVYSMDGSHRVLNRRTL